MKTAFDGKHVKGATAVALLNNGKLCGRLAANWSDNPAGAVCTATLVMYEGNPITGHHFSSTGKAGGHGYDKLSSAVYSALVDAGVDPKVVRPANGRTQDEFEAWGITYVSVI